MEIISEKQISNKQAIHFLKKSAKDEYIEENDPELAKNLSLVLTELQAHSAEIVAGEQPHTEEKKQEGAEEVEEKEEKEEEKPKAEETTQEEQKEEEKPAEEEEKPKEHKHKKHRKHKKEEQ